ncbi:MAG: flagellar biosynthetic protein FliO [Planctomycetes bacterium]|nr:flagellar biosynthetic protein FliO [Planctomycetota bacterium]
MNPVARKWDLTVRAGIVMCCALFLCAAAATAQTGDGAAAGASPEVATPSTSGALKVGLPPAGGDIPRAESTQADIPARDNLQDKTSDLEQNLIGGRSRDAEDGDSSPWLSLLGPLVVVLGIMAVVLWAARKFVPGMRRLGGSSAVRVLARTHLSPRQSITLVKVGQRILVVGQTADRLTTLAAITESDEVSQLLGECHSQTVENVSGSFKKVFRDVDSDFAAADEPQDDGAAEPELGRVRTQLDDLARKVREVAGLRR